MWLTSSTILLIYRFGFVFVLSLKHIFCLPKSLNNHFFQIACLLVSALQIFSVNKLYYVVFWSFFASSRFPRFSWSRFFKTQVFWGPDFSEFRFFRVLVFKIQIQGPDFLLSRFFWVWVQGPIPGSRSKLQK